MTTARGRRIVSVALLGLFVGLAMCQWHHVPADAPFASDQFVYNAAVDKAWRGEDPYLPYSIGWGYLYPPPSLLLFKGVNALSPPGVRPAVTFVGLSVVAAFLCFGLLGCKRSWEHISIAVLLFISAGMLDSLLLGQINAMVILCVALFLWAWRRQARSVACIALATAMCLKVTPLVFAAFLLTRRDSKWLLALAGGVAAWFVVAEALLPAPHLTASFVASFRWASAQYDPGQIGALWNFSLAVSLPRILYRLFGLAPPWGTLQWCKLVILALMVLPAYLVYLRRQGDTASTNALAVACNVCMVSAPNIVWLHHAALLIPGLWILLVDAGSRTLFLLAIGAMLCFQSLRCLQFELGVPPAIPSAAGQLMLIVAALLFAVSVQRSGDAHTATTTSSGRTPRLA